MGESFVDLSYRGLALGKRIKLTQVRPQTGFLEMPTPMPVGTMLGIATDEGVLFEAVVTEVFEQVGSATPEAARTPGMVVRPTLGVEAQDRWWRAHTELPPAQREDKAPPPADADGKVTVISPRMSGQVAVPELVDDGRDTGVMDAVDIAVAPAPLAEPPDTLVADVPVDPPSLDRIQRDTINMPMGAPMEEGPRTTAMDAVDLAALGLTPPSSSSDAIPVAKPEDYADETTTGTPEKPDGGGKKKKRSKRR